MHPETAVRSRIDAYLTYRIIRALRCGFSLNNCCRFILYESYTVEFYKSAHTTIGCGKQGFPSAQPYLSHTPGANPFCCMFLL
ncbi:hypothetical protein BO99DRAFT_348600 [Aspergillus violaceofuscus CBS 115571]|uniref:Uncharacterized protein n=1 Tax=Aspergillus violaceofuscus (strain CBS 115571) TaxID=1450538 RepID=A0A2V5GQ23_ASPV1|nr:hypothetical protein BO99DRAFT_348600 [Aspergillus violaceofuscus CBS 115571]